MRNEYQLKCGDGLHLEVKTGVAHFSCALNVGGK